MPKKRTEGSTEQHRRFIEAAREHGASEDPDVFEATLGQIATSCQPDRSKKTEAEEARQISGFSSI
jgi:hypothetical protein